MVPQDSNKDRPTECLADPGSVGLSAVDVALEVVDEHVPQFGLPDLVALTFLVGLAAFLVDGVHGGLQGVGEQARVSRQVDPCLADPAFGRLGLIQGLALLCGSLLIGGLWTYVNAPFGVRGFRRSLHRGPGRVGVATARAVGRGRRGPPLESRPPRRSPPPKAKGGPTRGPSTQGLKSRPPMPAALGGGGQLTVDRAGNGRTLRKVPSPGIKGPDGSPAGESPSHGAETTQPDGTVMVLHRRFRRDMMKRPPPLEQALSDGMRRFPDRRGERAVECCHERKGAYSHHLAAPARNRRCVSRCQQARPLATQGLSRGAPRLYLSPRSTVDALHDAGRTAG